MLSLSGKAERVKPGDIKTTAVMTVEGELDDISGSGQTQAALEMCSGVPANQKRHFEVKGAGHYGIFSGRRWRDMVYPAVKAFILDHNKAAVPKGRVQAATKAIAKPVAKPAAKPVAKPFVKVFAKPVVKTVAKSAARPATSRAAAKTTRRK